MKPFGLDDLCGGYKVKNDALTVYIASIIKGENICNLVGTSDNTSARHATLPCGSIWQAKLMTSDDLGNF